MPRLIVFQTASRGWPLGYWRGLSTSVRAGAQPVNPVSLSTVPPAGQRQRVGSASLLSCTLPGTVRLQPLILPPPGTGGVITLTDSAATSPARFYRVRLQ